MKRIRILDTTLRDGTQMEEFSLGVFDKISIARVLDDLGIDIIEGGWPGSNPKDADFFALAKMEPWKHAKLAAFCSTHHKKFEASKDPNLNATKDSGACVAVIFGKSSAFHAEKILGVSKEENLKMIEDSVHFLNQSGMEVIFDAEHFFDGFAKDPDYSLACVRAAKNGGAANVTLCDTNGGSLPPALREAVQAVKKEFPDLSIGIHAHNDCDLAVANTIAAVEAGVELIQGTINGIGERCGNANLCSLLPVLELKMGYQTVGRENIKKLSHVSAFVSERGNYERPKNLPFVGVSAFSHKGGIHVSAVRKDTSSYEHLNPEDTGNERHFTVSDLSGRSNLLEAAKRFGINTESLSDEFWNMLLKKVKEGEKDGLQFEGADASFELFVRRNLPNYTAPFVVENFFVHTSRLELSKDIPVEANVQGTIGGKAFHTAGFGTGPVGALDAALRKGLEEAFPKLKKIALVDYKVRIIEMDRGTMAKTRVVIETSDKKAFWTTVGCSQNIIEASLQSLIDSFEYFLGKE